jgi:3-methyl-2-oxobutanoate hydroxymethyltransferase
MQINKMTVCTFRKMKQAGEKIVMITAYDAPTAKIASSCGVDILLVGDSVANTILGYRNTLPLTLEQSLHHCAAVRRGSPNGFVVGDMPFMSYQAGADQAVINAARYIKECDADAVKLEGGANYAALIERMTSTGIPVMGHIGLLPQKVLAAGGYKLTGKNQNEAKSLINDAQQLEAAGAFAIVLEGIVAEIAAQITAAVSVPTIGIGAGANCDGQVQVVTDLLGIGANYIPKHAKRYAELDQIITGAFSEYVKDVKNGNFSPNEKP